MTPLEDMTEEQLVQHLLDNEENIKTAFFGDSKPLTDQQNYFTWVHPILMTADDSLRRVPSKNITPKVTQRICTHCGSTSLYRDYIHADLVCLDCATCMDDSLIDDAYRCMMYDDYGKLKYGSGSCRRRMAYKRKDYLAEILRNVNGQYLSLVPDAVMTMMRQTTKDKPVVSVTHVRTLIKKNKLQQYYCRAPYITCILNEDRGITRPQPLNHHEEARLCSLFNKFSYLWGRKQRGRKNCLNYGYVVFQLLAFVGREDLRTNVQLIKCKRRLRDHDQKWFSICQEASWEFTPVCRVEPSNTVKKLR